jgi:hypothetical protein
VRLKWIATGAVLGAVASASAGAVLASTGPATIRITDLQVADQTVGSGVGAREIVRTALYEHGGNRTRLGDGAMICTSVSRNQQSCSGSFTLPKGTLVVSGVRQSRLLYELAIVGGTDLYDNARGTLTATVTKLRPRRELLLFRLTG